MGDLVRVLNEEGIREFREYLAALREGVPRDPPWGILNDAWTSAKLQKQVVIERLAFKTKLAMARYLEQSLKPLGVAASDQNVGLWTWLSLYYFDQLCPLRVGGVRRAGVDYRYILELDYRSYYRHLLVGPYTAFKLQREKAALLLCTPVHQLNKYHLELACRQAFLTNRGVIEAASILYFDPKKGRPKSGAAVTTRKPGTLFRFIDVIQQLDLTYDLYSMSGTEVVSLLPAEFDEWRAQYTLT
jgi:hypothetical protein